MRQEELAPLGGGVDPEVFRRVWSRVMADGAERPIAVEQGKPAAGAVPSAPEARGTLPGGEGAPPRGPERPPKGEAAAPGDGALLVRSLEELSVGLGLARALARGPGRKGPVLAALTADYSRAARQLSAACFLLTGAGRPAGGGRSFDRPGLAQGLRELYWWERGWIGWCREAAGRAEDPFLRELYGSLAGTGQIHLSMIRSALEQLQGPALDGGWSRGVN